MHSDEAGMTLIETMASLVVLGIVLVGLGQGLTLGIRMNTESKTRINNLNLCKQLMEKMKSEVQYSQAVFDGANDNVAFNKTFYMDVNGQEVIAQNISPYTTQNTATRAYQVTVSLSDWKDGGGNSLRQTDSNGVSRVLVKALSVKVLTLHSAVAPRAPQVMREIAMSVEMVRPSS